MSNRAATDRPVQSDPAPRTPTARPNPDSRHHRVNITAVQAAPTSEHSCLSLLSMTDLRAAANYEKMQARSAENRLVTVVATLLMALAQSSSRAMADLPRSVYSTRGWAMWTATKTGSPCPARHSRRTPSRPLYGPSSDRNGFLTAADQLTPKLWNGSSSESSPNHPKTASTT